MTLESGADARQSMRDALRSSQLPLYTDVIERTDAGDSERSGIPRGDAKDGRLPGRIFACFRGGRNLWTAQRIDEPAFSRLLACASTSSKLLTGVATFLVYGGVAALLVYLIFRVFMNYVNMINNAANGIF